MTIPLSRARRPRRGGYTWTVMADPRATSSVSPRPGERTRLDCAPCVVRGLRRARAGTHQVRMTSFGIANISWVTTSAEKVGRDPGHRSDRRNQVEDVTVPQGRAVHRAVEGGSAKSRRDRGRRHGGGPSGRRRLTGRRTSSSGISRCPRSCSLAVGSGSARRFGGTVALQLVQSATGPFFNACLGHSQIGRNLGTGLISSFEQAEQDVFGADIVVSQP